MSAHDSSVRLGSRGADLSATPERRCGFGAKASPSTSTVTLGKSAAPKASAALALAMQVAGPSAKHAGSDRRSGSRKLSRNYVAQLERTTTSKATVSICQSKSACSLLASPKEECSPRLLPLHFSTMKSSGAPLLPPQTKLGLEGVERFCTVKPNHDGLGIARTSRASLVEDLTFNELVSRLGKTMNQASLLLNNRLRSLKNRCCDASLGETQQAELCQISDGLGAAAYHVQKWAYALGRSGQFHRPTKPSQSESADEAFVAVRFSLPRLMVNATESSKLLDAIVKAHNESAEAHVKRLGVSPDDIRAMVPHLERLLLRLARLSSSIHPRDRPSSTFIAEYFAPVIGRRLARALVPYIM